MRIPSEYDILAEEIGIVDKQQFLNNLEILSKSDKKYSEIFKELVDKKNKKAHIAKNLNKQKFINEISKYYDCINAFMISSTYIIICETYKYKVNTNLKQEDMQDIIYKAYIENYSLFTDTLEILDKNPLKWIIPIKTVTKVEEKPIEIPKEPYIPSHILEKANALHNE